ncbi:MAG: MBL fold metallo-hydrolase, partial [Bacteroidales bacterium]|nr:MBL fold metallo-hydrolase [Bacteroidales bacterium]
MKISNIRAEDWKMDGGAGFGLIPKTIWSKLYPADENNCILMSSRLMLIETDDRKILIDTGMGSKRGDKFYKFKYIQDTNSLSNSLKEAEIKPESITDVIITHLHDDHIGGATYYQGDQIKLYFPNAIHWVSKAQWDWALNPNKREAGSYFRDNFIPIKEAGKLKLIEKNGEYIPNIEFRIYNGHTVGNIVPIIKYKDKKIAYMGDFIPYVAALPLPYISANDIQPLLSLSEKEEFLNEAAKEDIYLYFQHDYYNE